MASQRAGILIVDDELSVRDSLLHWFRKDGYDVATAANAIEAIKALDQAPCDVVLLDIKMPGMDGMELLSRIRSTNTSAAVIMMTAFASVDTAVRALKNGAFDYVTKPIDPDELSHLVRRALKERKLEEENSQMRETIAELSAADFIVGESIAMRKVMELIRQVAQTSATVMIRGESGTGKELVARTIHANSSRKYFAIVPINCGALPDSLLESELFGHEKGAFTGAQFRRKGRLEMADGGTLFLDEIGSISSKMQVDLLRVIENGEFLRLGGSKSVKADFRVICATNEDLEKQVAAGQFRQDLYYRINVFNITVPPLRERREDIPPLAFHFVKKLALQIGKQIADISPEAIEKLVAYDWPGNVRELANAIERAMVVGRRPSIQADDLPFSLPFSSPAGRGAPTTVGDSLADMEKVHITTILRRTRWNISQSAEILQIDRATLYNKIRKYDLQREETIDGPADEMKLK
jgi:DNA-binding NtrC family response regulator